jgi:hypothetical protein
LFEKNALNDVIEATFIEIDFIEATILDIKKKAKKCYYSIYLDRLCMFTLLTKLRVFINYYFY